MNECNAVTQWGHLSALSEDSPRFKKTSCLLCQEFSVTIYLPFLSDRIAGGSFRWYKFVFLCVQEFDILLNVFESSQRYRSCIFEMQDYCACFVFLFYALSISLLR
mmetsp:Transcript_28202/g.43885  ORF Transcript_28202/g.43885 Transcript_28202/m.43885 type:complete len:106 (-) Transcript_28202:2369-2686(-)